jgi:hypothetical protein
MAMVMLAGMSVAGCADEGPITDCIVADGRGSEWRGSDITPLGAQEAAIIACGQQSPDPTTCVVKGCRARW